WALSVVFLVFTLRAILYKPFVKQIRTTKKMQEINPQLQAIRKKYAKDRVKMTEEMQKLQKEHGFNPLLGCLPMLLQVPVFIGLFHVLRSFNRTATGMGQLGMT
ncbi:membrane protein insertase YidC, partial [Streptomyces sp. SID10244]|nr:membrane protein insertase YidC [Streptomyces sp. SID10244]